MSLKELGTGAVIVIGGIAYTVSEGGLSDALSEDIKHISEVSYQERSAYMTEIVDQFSDTFDYFILQTDNYDYVGAATFKAVPTQARFESMAQAEETTDKANIEGVKKLLQNYDLCGQDDIVMFTEKGWSYQFTMKDAQGRRFYSQTCSPDVPTLRGAIG